MNNRSKLKRRIMKVQRYEARYIKPPHGVLGTMELPSGLRLIHQYHGWTYGEKDRILFRSFRRI